MPSNPEMTEKILQAINKLVPGVEVFLFGSRVRGSATNESDWDILILLNKVSTSFSEETKIMDGLYDLELETGQVFAPIIYDKVDWEVRKNSTVLFENIRKEAIQLQ